MVRGALINIEGGVMTRMCHHPSRHCHYYPHIVHSAFDPHSKPSSHSPHHITSASGCRCRLWSTTRTASGRSRISSMPPIVCSCPSASLNCHANTVTVYTNKRTYSVHFRPAISVVRCARVVRAQRSTWYQIIGSCAGAQMGGGRLLAAELGRSRD